MLTILSLRSTMPSPHTSVLQVISILAITVASMINAVNVLLLLGAVKGMHVFTPEAKFSPMSFTKLTHEVRDNVWLGTFLMCWQPG